MRSSGKRHGRIALLGVLSLTWIVYGLYYVQHTQTNRTKLQLETHQQAPPIQLQDKQTEQQATTAKSQETTFMSQEAEVMSQETVGMSQEAEVKSQQGAGKNMFIQNDRRSSAKGKQATTNLIQVPEIHTDIDCMQLFRNNTDAIEAAIVYQNKNPWVIVPNENFAKLNSTGCQSFKQRRHYILSPITEEELNFPISYSIMAYKEVEQVEGLLRAIYRPQNYYCIHVDKSADRNVKRGLAAIAGCFPNVDMASQSVDVEWGLWTVVQAELVCMKDHLRYPDWKYHINLAGQEFPLKTNRELVRILKMFNGSNVVQGSTNIDRLSQQRFKFIYSGAERLRKRLYEERKPPYDMEKAKGSFLITATRDFVDFVINHKNMSAFTEWVKTLWVPDESYFTMLNYNPHVGAPGAYKGLDGGSSIPPLNRYIDWMDPKKEVQEPTCYGQYVREVCVLSVGDLHKLYDTPELFANKFYLDYHPMALRCMEQLLHNRTSLEIQTGNVRTNFNQSYYTQFEFTWNHV